MLLALVRNIWWIRRRIVPAIITGGASHSKSKQSSDNLHVISIVVSKCNIFVMFTKCECVV
ncbi:hypothetical protein COEREDRAFT_76176 [Coemansia reversa NRRL 1564]|uniref:Uncharacterized protein n=1 Tax=Coemansia reversa (strain ATCC 12441 / NRRL 1564) TaxID=763665 RepID=A0A2G5B6C9_COERN|nr:hypothetical protein COEREDRAFT_76176 [Coemansia reversa NRRL 1564]|eukprot:PIA14603.1 hypothetical protein COEREDRAFT_76176 [Coemansia reversa NRRL 1564]